jgi:hypothetical protein
MARTPMRRLVLGGATYLWRVSHRHRVVDRPGRDVRGCAEMLTVYLDGHPRAPLRVVFAEGDGVGREYIERSGVVVDYRVEPFAATNLHEPGTVRRLVELALARGWDPASERQPHLIEDGYSLLREA